MEFLNRVAIATPAGENYISVNICDIKDLDETIDVLTVSAFYKIYDLTPKTLICALGEMGVSVEALAQNPDIDLREVCHTWLSKEVNARSLPIGRIGCIEMSPYREDRGLWEEKKMDIITSIQAYFRMLDIALLTGVKIETVGLPILGTGSQKIDMNLIEIPLLNECVSFLKRNSRVKEIKIFDRNPQKAFQFAKNLDNSYTMQKETYRSNSVCVGAGKESLAFISYSSADKNIADNLCAKLEAAGVKVWYAPRDILYNDYASSIVNAIARCTHFIVILSANSLKSNHVLNEIDLAFSRLTADENVRFCPLKIDEEMLGPAFRYYLSRQHWMDAHVPPIEKRLDEFVMKVFG